MAFRLQKYKTLALAACGLLLGFCFALPAQAQTLDDMEAVLVKAGDLNTFLNSPQLIDEYYKSAAEYYGLQAFPKESYQAILQQVRIAVARDPEFAKRAWETNLGKSFTVVSEAPTYGRDLNVESWDRYLADLKEKLIAQSGDLHNEPWSRSKLRIEEQVRRLQQMTDEHEKQVGSEDLKKSERAALSGKFYQSLKSDTSFQQAASYLLYQYLDFHKEVFESGNADLILNVLKEIKDQPKKVTSYFTGPQGIDNGEALASLIKNVLPDIGTLLKDEKLFPVHYLQGRDGKKIAAEAGAGGGWSFVPSPRRFHAFFKGLPFSECVGGNSQTLSSLTPERWATVILKDTQFHYVEKDGLFLGWVQEVPISHGADTYASVDFSSRIFRQGIIERRSDGTLFADTMIGGWLRQAMKNKPANWKGFVSSESYAISNGGSLPALKSSPSYLLGEKYSPKNDPFSHSDPQTVEMITHLLPRTGFAERYGGSMIFDAAVPDAGVLTVLKITDQSLYSLVKQAIDRKDQKYVNRLLEIIGTYGYNDLGILRSAHLLGLLAQNGFQYKVDKMDTAEFVKKLIEDNYSLDEIKAAQKLVSGSNGARSLNITAALVKSSLVTDGDSAIAAIVDEKYQTTKYMNANELSQLIASLRFQSLDGYQIRHFQKLLSLTTKPQDALAVLKECLPLIQSGEDFLSLIKTNSAIRATPQLFDIFFSKSPTAEQVIELANLGSPVWSTKEKAEFASYASRLDHDLKGISEHFKDKDLREEIQTQHILSQPNRQMSPDDLRLYLKAQLSRQTLAEGWAETYERYLAFAPTDKDFFNDLVMFPNATGGYSKAIAKIVHDFFPRLMAMNLSYSQIIKLINMKNSYEPETSMLIAQAVEKAQTGMQVLDVLSMTQSFWKDPEYKNKLIKLYRQYKYKMAQDPEILQRGPRLDMLRKALGMNDSILELLYGVLEKQLKVTRNNIEFHSMLGNLLSLSSGDSVWESKIKALGRKNYQNFLNLHPSRRGISVYRAEFMGPVSKTMTLFSRPKDIKAPRCELVHLIRF